MSTHGWFILQDVVAEIRHELRVPLLKTRYVLALIVEDVISDRALRLGLKQRFELGMLVDHIGDPLISPFEKFNGRHGAPLPITKDRSKDSSRRFDFSELPVMIIRSTYGHGEQLAAATISNLQVPVPEQAWARLVGLFHATRIECLGAS